MFDQYVEKETKKIPYPVFGLAKQVQKASTVSDVGVWYLGTVNK